MCWAPVLLDRVSTPGWPSSIPALNMDVLLSKDQETESRDINVYLAHQKARNPECRLYCKYVAAVCRFEVVFLDRVLEAA